MADEALTLPTIIEETHATKDEGARAAWWRTNIVKLTVKELADLTGYSAQAIYLMERGINSAGKPVEPWAWQRYRMTCAGVQLQIVAQAQFEWR